MRLLPFRRPLWTDRLVGKAGVVQADGMTIRNDGTTKCNAWISRDATKAWHALLPVAAFDPHVPILAPSFAPRIANNPVPSGDRLRSAFLVQTSVRGDRLWCFFPVTDDQHGVIGNVATIRLVEDAALVRYEGRIGRIDAHRHRPDQLQHEFDEIFMITTQQTPRIDCCRRSVDLIHATFSFMRRVRVIIPQRQSKSMNEEEALHRIPTNASAIRCVIAVDQFLDGQLEAIECLLFHVPCVFGCFPFKLPGVAFIVVFLLVVVVGIIMMTMMVTSKRMEDTFIITCICHLRLA
mmetsp:Transcript_12706/g.36966  ORF Transcript_12706/g.36966 Transcript_12706/m.36966 type:complete len:293 (-) Transcript_12706:1021-1899(-)